MSFQIRKSHVMTNVDGLEVSIDTISSSTFVLKMCDDSYNIIKEDDECIVVIEGNFPKRREQVYAGYISFKHHDLNYVILHREMHGWESFREVLLNNYQVIDDLYKLKTL